MSSQGELLCPVAGKNSLDSLAGGACACCVSVNRNYQQLQNGYREDEILQAKAKLRSAEALSKYSSRRAARAEQLQGQTAISEEQMEEAIYEAQRALQEVVAAEADYQHKTARLPSRANRSGLRGT